MGVGVGVGVPDVVGIGWDVGVVDGVGPRVGEGAMEEVNATVAVGSPVDIVIADVPDMNAVVSRLDDITAVKDVETSCPPEWRRKESG